MLIVMSLLSIPAFATQPGSGMNHLSAELMTSADFIPGETTILGLNLSIDEGWHTYWPGINDTGYGVSIEFEPVEGLTFHEPVFPTPKRYIAAGNILDHIYEGEVLILIPVSVDDAVSAGQAINLSVSIDYLICKEVCIPESITTSLQIQSQSASPSVSSEPKSLTHLEGAYYIFGPIRLEVTQPYESGPSGFKLHTLPMAHDNRMNATYFPHLDWQTDEVTLKINGASHYIFFPDANCTQPADLIAQGESESDSITISFDRQFDSDTDAARLSGRLSVQFGHGWRDFDIDFTQPLKQETTP